MRNFVQHGDTVTIAAAAAAVLSGAVVVVGKIIGVAANDAALGGELVLATEGVFEVPTDGTAINQGDALYVDANSRATKTAGANFLGAAWGGAAAGAAGANKVAVKLGGWSGD